MNKLILLGLIMTSSVSAHTDPRIEHYRQQHSVTQQQLAVITHHKIEQWLANSEQLIKQLPPAPIQYHLNIDTFKQQEHHFHVPKHAIKTTR